MKGPARKSGLFSCPEKFASRALWSYGIAKEYRVSGKMNPQNKIITIDRDFDVARNDAVLPENFLSSLRRTLSGLAAAYNAYNSIMGGDYDMTAQADGNRVSLIVSRYGVQDPVAAMDVTYDAAQNGFQFRRTGVQDAGTDEVSGFFQLTHGGIHNLRACYLSTVQDWMGDDVYRVEDYMNKPDLLVHRELMVLKQFMYGMG